MKEAWVLVDPDGKVLWDTAGVTKERCCISWGYNYLASEQYREHPPTDWFEDKSYTFARVAVIPDGWGVSPLPKVFTRPEFHIECDDEGEPI